jgi:hypothetical protein
MFRKKRMKLGDGMVLTDCSDTTDELAGVRPTNYMLMQTTFKHAIAGSSRNHCERVSSADSFNSELENLLARVIFGSC